MRPSSEILLTNKLFGDKEKVLMVSRQKLLQLKMGETVLWANPAGEKTIREATCFYTPGNAGDGGLKGIWMLKTLLNILYSFKIYFCNFFLLQTLYLLCLVLKHPGQPRDPLELRLPYRIRAIGGRKFQTHGAWQPGCEALLGWKPIPTDGLVPRSAAFRNSNCAFKCKTCKLER